MLRRMASTVAVSALLSACAPAASEPPASPSTSASSSASASASASSSVAASPLSSECTPPVLCGGSLAAGEYSANSGSTEITFTVDEGWAGSEYEDLGFELLMVDEGVPHAISAAPYAGVVYSDVCSGAETEEIGPKAADFAAFMADRPGIEMQGEPAEITVGARSGLQFDVDAVDPGCESDPPDRVWLWELGGVTDFHLSVGEAARLIALDDESGVIVLIIETFDPAQFDALLEKAQPIIDSMTFS